MAVIYESHYKDISAVTLESKDILAQFLPEYGGKMASLIRKSTGREYLVQDKGRKYRPLAYDGDFELSECSGFDDMFPSIDTMFYPFEPWKGVAIPDHGEVCGLSWDWEIQDNALLMSVHGIRFPYQLQKKIHFRDSRQLSIAYQANNLSSFDLDFLWASHLMLDVESGGEIIVPYAVPAPVTCVSSADPEFGSRGQKMDWPLARRADDRIQDLQVTRPLDLQGNRYKYYFDQRIPAGWCGYRYHSDGSSLKMQFPVDRVPYLGIWVNEGSFHQYRTIALEVCTGSYDRPDLARLHGQFSVLPAKGQYNWHLDLAIEE